VLRLYDELLAMTGSPVVAVNRALALAEVDGAAAALEMMPTAADEPRLAAYQPYWAARADLLARAGAIGEALHAFDVAIGLAGDEAARRFLEQRRAGLAG
jgi:RNA polymerase sigma-70 factor (ECF subfamily)